MIYNFCASMLLLWSNIWFQGSSLRPCRGTFGCRN